MGLLDKLKDMLQGKSATVEKGVDTAAGLAQKATGGKFDDKIDMAADKAKEAAAKLTGEGETKGDSPTG